MKHRTFFTRVVMSATVMAAALSAGSCTSKSAEPPPLMGPSELGTSITMALSPDVIYQDGASQSVVTITARDPNGQPLRNLALRTEIAVGGTTVDFGSLSARTVVTDSAGRATLVYTAPAAPPSAAGGQETLVNIIAIPMGSDYGNAWTRLVTLRLIPTGVITPPGNLAPRFTVSPVAPVQGQNALFEACAPLADMSPCSPANNPIATYSWNFDDGSTGSGVTASHAFSTPGNYFVALTITDTVGRSQTTTRTVAVSQSAAPTATFVFSPTNPRVAQSVNFNASGAQPAAGRQIVSYRWDFGDGTFAESSGPTTSHEYAQARIYTVTLVVTDDIGRTTTFSQTLTVAVSSAP
jgi:hypothetical protein